MSDEPKPRGRPPLDATERKGSSLNVRMRGELKARLAQAALENGRSISGEIEYRLNQSFATSDIRQIVRGEISAAQSLSHAVTVRLPRSKPMNDAMIARFYGRDHLPS